MAAYSGCGERDGRIGHGERRSRTGLARVCGDVGSVADGRAVRLNQSQGGMCIYRVLGIGAGVSQECFGP